MSELFALDVRGSMPDLNDVLNDAKRHWSAYSRVKKAVTTHVQALAQSTWSGREPIGEPVLVRCTWEVKGARKDPDNVSFAVKYLLDGLVKAGVLKDDGPRQVLGITHAFRYGQQVDGVRIELIGRADVEAA